MDSLTSAERSERMHRIKSKDTKPEIIVRKFLHAKGFRFRLHDKLLSGRPDLKLTKYKTVILINGCFWHGHDHCKYAQEPTSNIGYWANKIQNNKQKDLKNQDALVALGWKIIIVWECELKKGNREKTLHSLLQRIVH